MVNKKTCVMALYSLEQGKCEDEGNTQETLSLSSNKSAWLMLESGSSDPVGSFKDSIDRGESNVQHNQTEENDVKEGDKGKKEDEDSSSLVHLNQGSIMGGELSVKRDHPVNKVNEDDKNKVATPVDGAEEPPATEGFGNSLATASTSSDSDDDSDDDSSDDGSSSSSSKAPSIVTGQPLPRS